MTTYYHLSGAMLALGATILPGNYGRLIRAYGWQHTSILREMALEESRQARFQHRPSRLDCAFGFLTAEEAHNFRRMTNGFVHHQLYRVRIADPTAPMHITDSRLCAPWGAVRHNWADVYWMDFQAQATAIPGVNWAAATNGIQLREVLTLSNLVVEERLN